VNEHALIVGPYKKEQGLLILIMEDDRDPKFVNAFGAVHPEQESQAAYFCVIM
jgi:hypothetical protein